MWCLFSFGLVLVTVGFVHGDDYLGDDKDLKVLERAVGECLQTKDRYSCFADKAAIAVERSMNWDIQIFDGFKFKRNDRPVNQTQARSFTGMDRFTNALYNFFSTHSLTLNFFNVEGDVEGRAAKKGNFRDGYGKKKKGDGLTGLGSLGINKKAIKKEYKYMKYAFMVLLGIFGLTGPVVMKTLALIAGNALLASKAAMLIVGGVALKKIFEHSDHHHEKPTVKVHTIPSYDDHDRLGYNHMYYNPYPYNTYTNS